MDINSRLNRIFFYILLLICLLNVFYIPGQYTDRFFTSGMIWLGITVPACFCLFLFLVGGGMRLSAIWLYIVALVIVHGMYAWDVGTFSMQQMAYTIALCLLIVMLDNSREYLRSEGVYLLLSAMALAESILGLAQYFRGYEVYSSGFPVTGTFENPAGFAAYLAVSFPFALFFIFCSSWRWRIWGMMVSFVLVVAVILSGSRTGIISLTVVVIGIGCWYLVMKQQAFRLILLSGFMISMLLLFVLYFLKKDSADGRLLIWRCTCDMIGEKPFVGHGPDSFEGQYMLYQARWLAQHPDERWKELADNVKHPFNEYLKIISEYGLLGLVALFILLWWLYRLYKRSDPMAYPLFLSILAATVCSLFSYPLNYPSVCLLLCIAVGLISRESIGVYIKKQWLCGLAFLCGVGVFIFTVFWMRSERNWYHMAQRSLVGETVKVLPDYAGLYPFMRENPLFLYNYGAELHEVDCWSESAKILEECSRGMNDTDVQMLLADNYLHLKEFDKAELYYLQAARMCPNRFLPLYHLMRLYKQTGCHEEALSLAQEIVEKPVKVPSYVIEKIKQEMLEYIQKEK